ncbi:MAG: PRC-barrel domain-containing protein [Caldilineaceae bacterium]|nr:PRC-barrel domain-containing protein [Caldilineaceae bacterium]
MIKYGVFSVMIVFVLVLGACNQSSPAAAPAATATEVANEADATVTAAVSDADATATQAPVAADATATEATTGAEATATSTAASTMNSSGARTNLIRASNLVGYRVYDPQNEDMGTIHDMLVLRSDEDLAYAVVSVGGFLGIGDTLHLVPWWAFTLDQANSRLTLNVTPEILKAAPTYSADALPNVADPNWDTDLVAYWETVEPTPASSSALTTTNSVTGTTGVTATTAMTATENMTAIESMTATESMTVTEDVSGTADMTGTHSMTETGNVTGTVGVTATDTNASGVISLNALQDYSVQDTAGDKIGSIEDIMINPQQGRIEYMILSFGGFLGFGDKWFAVPLTASEIRTTDKTIVLDVTPEMLKSAPGFNKNELPSTADANWDQEIRDYWQQHK